MIFFRHNWDWGNIDIFQTFRPKKSFDDGTLRHRLHKQANASLHSGIDLQDVVRLPPGEDRNDWVAVHGKWNTDKYCIKFQCSPQEFCKDYDERSEYTVPNWLCWRQKS